MANDISRFLTFQREEGGVFPPAAAAQYLGLSLQGLRHRQKKRNLKSYVFAGVRYYSVRAIGLERSLDSRRWPRIQNS